MADESKGGPPLVWRDQPRKGFTTNTAMVVSFVAALLAWGGASAVFGTLGREFDLWVPDPVQRWVPIGLFVVVLLGLSLLLVRKAQRLAADRAAVDPSAPPVSAPTAGSTAGTVGSSLLIGLAGFVIGLLIVGVVSAGIVYLLASVGPPEWAYAFILVPLVAIVGGVVGMAIAMGNRKR